MQKTTGFIGAGNMAEAIIAGMTGTGLFMADSIIACDKSKERLISLEEKYGIRISESNRDVFLKSNIVILAVKPQNMKEVLEEIKPDQKVCDRKIIISIAAGIKTGFIEKILFSGIDENQKNLFAVSRTMPNTPGLAGAGITGICFNSSMSEEDIQTVRNIFGSIGKIIPCSEDAMDAVTAMTGSGPAYVFYFIESMMEAGKKLGFTEEESLFLAIETVKGSVKLMESSSESPEILRKKVTSPGGTTEAGIGKMESCGVKKGIVEGVLAAAERSAELSRILEG
jgi:pyrroline-5-carboxylate reductase